MQMVIDIPEKDYEYAKAYMYGRCNVLAINNTSRILGAIADGTPLRKGYGRLGDLDKIKKEMQNYHDDCEKTSEYTRLGFETAIAIVEDAETIIEADRSEGE